MTDELPKSTIGQRSAAYFGFGSDHLAETTRRPSVLRIVLVLCLVAGVGILLCAVGYSGVGAPIIAVAVLSAVTTWYRIRTSTKHP